MRGTCPFAFFAMTVSDERQSQPVFESDGMKASDPRVALCAAWRPWRLAMAIGDAKNRGAHHAMNSLFVACCSVEYRR